MMTTSEAREIYLEADCSYFQMCNSDYSRYKEYRRFGTPKEQEEIWRNEKIEMLYKELQVNGDYQIFNKMYDIAEAFRDYQKLQLMYDALFFLKNPMNPQQRVSVAETILGRRACRVRSGLVYWAYDIDQKGVAILFLKGASHYLDISYVGNVELHKRITRARRLCKKINGELELSVDFVEKKVAVS